MADEEHVEETTFLGEGDGDADPEPLEATEGVEGADEDKADDGLDDPVRVSLSDLGRPLRADILY